MAGILKRRHYHVTAIDVFREHRIQPHRVGDSRRSIYLAGTPPSATGRRVAASAHPSQLPFHRAGIAIAWIFNLWGLADLLNAFYQANHAGLLAGQLGATYFIPTLVVPLLLITHGLAFRILLQHQPEPAMQESRHLA